MADDGVVEEHVLEFGSATDVVDHLETKAIRGSDGNDDPDVGQWTDHPADQITGLIVLGRVRNWEALAAAGEENLEVWDTAVPPQQQSMRPAGQRAKVPRVRSVDLMVSSVTRLSSVGSLEWSGRPVARSEPLWRLRWCC